MPTIFWVSPGIMFVDYLEMDKIITGTYYASLLDRLKNELQEKRPLLANKKIGLSQKLK